jgi:hypothetical protein
MRRRSGSNSRQASADVAPGPWRPFDLHVSDVRFAPHFSHCAALSCIPKADVE